MSYSIVRWRVRRTTARPCPTSSMRTSRQPAGGPSTRSEIRTSIAINAAWRPGQAFGNTVQATRVTRLRLPNPSIIVVDTAAFGITSARSMSHRSSSILAPEARKAISPAAARGPSSITPASVSGTVATLKSGTATKFTSGATKETRPKFVTVNGIRPNSRNTCTAAS